MHFFYYLSYILIAETNVMRNVNFFFPIIDKSFFTFLSIFNYFSAYSFGVDFSEKLFFDPILLNAYL